MLHTLNALEAATVNIFASCSVVGSYDAVIATAPVTSTIALLDRPKAPVAPTLATSVVVPEIISTLILIGTVYSHNPSVTATNVQLEIISGDTPKLLAPFSLSPPTGAVNSSGAYCFVQIFANSNLPPTTNFDANSVCLIPITVRAVDSGSSKYVDTVIAVPVFFLQPISAVFDMGGC